MQLLPNIASSDPSKSFASTSSTSSSTTITTNDCPSSTLDFITPHEDIKCDTVAVMEWFLTTKEGILSLQGLTKGLSLEQIQQQEIVTSRKTTNCGDHVLTAASPVVLDADDNRPLNSNNNNKKKATSSSNTNGGVPTVAPISRTGEEIMLSKCSPYLKDPLIAGCDTIASMIWFLTKDEGIASLQGMVDGMDPERIVQRHAIISIFKDFNMMITTTNKETDHARMLGISFVFNECDMEGITCDSTNQKITKIELSKC